MGSNTRERRTVVMWTHRFPSSFTPNQMLANKEKQDVFLYIAVSDTWKRPVSCTLSQRARTNYTRSVCTLPNSKHGIEPPPGYRQRALGRPPRLWLWRGWICSSSLSWPERARHLGIWRMTGSRSPETIRILETMPRKARGNISNRETTRTRFCRISTHFQSFATLIGICCEYSQTIVKP